MTITIEGYCYRFYGLDRIRGGKRSKYLYNFEDCVDSVCFMIDGSSIQNIQNSVDSFTEAFFSISALAGISIIVVDIADLQNLKSLPPSCTLPLDMSKGFVSGLEAYLKSIIARRNFTGKFYFDLFDSSSQTAFDCVIKRARDLLISLRQDQIMFVTTA